MAGKGTQAKLLAKETGYQHVSTGDLFRAEAKSGSELGKELQDYMSKGLLVPDEVTVEVLKKNLPDKCILDGFPRTVPQAQKLNEITNIDLVVDVKCSDELIVKRTVARRICKNCGAIYGLTVPSKVEGVCDECQGELGTRKDDTEEVIKDRLKVYNEQTLPILEYYQDKLVEVDGEKPVMEILQEILKVLKTKGLYNK